MGCCCENYYNEETDISHMQSMIKCIAVNSNKESPAVRTLFIVQRKMKTGSEQSGPFHNRRDFVLHPDCHDMDSIAHLLFL